jgi:hypothetical protein
MMKLTLYANGSEVRLGEGGGLSRTDFFCVDERVHVERRSTWAQGAGFPQEEWGELRPCDGSCRIWLEKALDMPEALKQEIAFLL